MPTSNAPPIAAPTWLTGQLLIAMPTLRDSRFAQSVIFMCAHTADGAMGVVLNQPLKKPGFAELLGQLGVKPAPPRRKLPLGVGGPVDDNRGFVLHTGDWSCAGSMQVTDDFVLTANVDILNEIAQGGGPEQAILLLGYAGWEAGQLDEEIKQNAWLTVPPDEALVFDAAYETKWGRALKKLNIDPGRLSGEAGRA